MDRELLQALARAGLTGQEYAVVLAILAHGNPTIITLDELSAVTGIAKPNICRAREKLAQRGILSYKPPLYSINLPRGGLNPLQNDVQNSSQRNCANSTVITRDNEIITRDNEIITRDNEIITGDNMLSPVITVNNKEHVCMYVNKRRREIDELLEFGFLDPGHFIARHGRDKVREAIDFIRTCNPAPKNPGAALRALLERGEVPKLRQRGACGQAARRTQRWEKYFRGRYGSQLRLLEEGRDGGFCDR